jgi:copper transport protein
LICACAAAFAAAHLVHPAVAWAHARLKKSEPSAASRLKTPPREIRLWFTEKPEVALTKVSIADSAGHPVAVEAAATDTAGPMTVRVPIAGALTSGRYTVKWSTVAVDGHPLNGTFTFRLDLPGPVVSPVSVEIKTPEEAHVDSAVKGDAGPSANSLSAIIARTVSFAALITLIGAVAFRFAVLPRVLGLGGDGHADLAGATATLASIATAVCIVGAVARLAVQGSMISPDAGEMRVVAMGTEWGAAWRVQVGAAVVAFIGFLLARSRIALGWGIALAGVLVLAVATAAGGHAVADADARTLAVATDAIHIMGAGGWIGSLLVLVTMGHRVASRGGEGRGRRVAALVNAFSPAALAFAGVLVVTGGVSAWLRLGTLAALWTSPYGVMLIRKLVMVGLVVLAGAYNWRRMRPTLGADDTIDKMHRSATIELALSAVVIIMTAVLVAMPTPVR